ncbi:MAG: ABC transporter ATP-binding protein [Dehalococcoidia bacterium]|nr:ABC transporter ATP-binding protein [Dehalococcoidia bacterium]
MGAIHRLMDRVRGTTSPGEREKLAVAVVERAEPPAYSHRHFSQHKGPLLEVKGIHKSFGGVRAIDDVDMKVDAGSIHALIGPNGSGKTTMLNLVSGFYTVDGGSIEFGGQRIVETSPHRTARLGIARTFQTPKVLGGSTVLENVMLGLFMHGRSGLVRTIFRVPPASAEEKAVRSKALEWLQFVGLAHRQNELAKNLPHGQQRFLEMARAMASEPYLLLLDEPAAGLSHEEIARLDDIITKVRGLGCTVLLVEHHVNLVMKISDRITVLDYGAKIAEGTPDEVRSSPEVIRAYLGDKV